MKITISFVLNKIACKQWPSVFGLPRNGLEDYKASLYHKWTKKTWAKLLFLCSFLRFFPDFINFSANQLSFLGIIFWNQSKGESLHFHNLLQFVMTNYQNTSWNLLITSIVVPFIEAVHHSKCLQQPFIIKSMLGVYRFIVRNHVFIMTIGIIPRRYLGLAPNKLQVIKLSIQLDYPCLIFWYLYFHCITHLCYCSTFRKHILNEMSKLLLSWLLNQDLVWLFKFPS